jgi:hypothetical protein
MKKLLVLSLAVAMVVAFTLPASAFESVFGGYWRTRAFHQEDFSGNDDVQTNGQHDTGVSRVDTRTRLYYTAVLNDNLKLVNKFEWNNTWGDTVGGDYGADGTGIFRIKESYVDANIGPVRAQIGEKDVTWARGFIYADEYSGAELSFKAGDALIPFTWMKGNEGGTNSNSKDTDIVGLWPIFTLGEGFTLNPFVIYGYSKDGDGANALSTYGANGGVTADDGVGVYWIGANADATLGSVGLWFTGSYLGGELKQNVGDNIDVKAYLLAGGANVPLGPASLHGQAFYASGDDDENDTDAEAFFGIGGGGRGWAYYWSEIMGLGLFDNQASAGSPGGDVSNLWAVNIGASISPMEKLKLTGDLWYASHVEDDFTTDEKKLGTEVDLMATYQLIEGLNLDLVGAYLFADDGTSTDGNNDDNPYEIGTRLSLSF